MVPQHRAAPLLHHSGQFRLTPARLQQPSTAKTCGVELCLEFLLSDCRCSGIMTVLTPIIWITGQIKQKCCIALKVLSESEGICYTPNLLIPLLTRRPPVFSQTLAGGRRRPSGSWWSASAA